MKREKILIFINNKHIHIYLVNRKKEIIEDLNTSSFFEYGEIKDVHRLENEINKIFIKNKLFNNILKPTINILYNDITHSDMEYLYNSVFNDIGSYNITLHKMSKLINKLSKQKEIVYFDGECYTDFKNKVKYKNLKHNKDDKVIIGKNIPTLLHYSDNEIIWNLFKSKFTN